MGINQHFDMRGAQPLAGHAGPGDTTSKLLGLELLRFASALAVLLFHYNHFARMAGMPALAPSAQPFHNLLWPMYDYGQFGVQLFWGISGYIFFWKYGAAIHEGAVSARKFFWFRFSRLYPLHLVTLFAVVALQVVHRKLTGLDFVYPATDPAVFTRQLFLATDWASPVALSFNGPIWSISGEIAVYAVFFLAMCQFQPSSNLCIGMIIAGLVLQLAGLNWASIGCATYFFAGGLASLAPNAARKPACLILIALCLGLAADVVGGRDNLPIIMVLAVPCLLVVVSRGWPALDRWSRTIQFAGNLTYSSYLLHFPLQLTVAILVAATGMVLPLTNPLFLLGYLAVTVAAAGICYRRLELPAQQWLRRRTLQKPAIA